MQHAGHYVQFLYMYLLCRTYSLGTQVRYAVLVGYMLTSVRALMGAFQQAKVNLECLLLDDDVLQKGRSMKLN